MFALLSNLKETHVKLYYDFVQEIYIKCMNINMTYALKYAIIYGGVLIIRSN